MNLLKIKDTYQYAMHGNGAYKGLRQTNTEDALIYWYRKGVRIFEIDMAKTSDSEYVAVAHHLNKKDLRRLEIFDLPENCTSKWFMGHKLFSISTKGLKPLSMGLIIELLIKYNDMIVMLDLFGLFTSEETAMFVENLSQYIGNNVEIWDRLLIESYNKEMVMGIQNVTARANIIACVRFEKNEDDKTTITPQELLEKNIRFISYPWYCTLKHPGEIENFSKNGITVFSRTKDNTLDMRLKRAGVSVNIIAQRYDGGRIIYQYPLYMMSYLKRIFIKVYIKLRYR
ncbi:hypothetical protein MCG98_10180 [Ruminococcus sp. OA3]|uniref:hypothetical protein n=1 Tax=Ruminococcus sp. OA3 TaxID=2914164 RepID=UPI001F070191|nr:hypothetical protein [Ruminococcus sp. OA3]MCH1982931.1 hypothetical protein [Ruminococcus sp. OA3]